jgi:hypothetical protein
MRIVMGSWAHGRLPGEDAAAPGNGHGSGFKITWLPAVRLSLSASMTARVANKAMRKEPLFFL